MNIAKLKSELFRKSKAFEKLDEAIGDEGMAFLCHAIGALGRLLPHTKTSRWTVKARKDSTRVKWADNKRRSIVLNVMITGSTGDFCLLTTLTRMTAAGGVGQIERVLDLREFDLCEQVATRISTILQTKAPDGASKSLRAIRSLFDEQVVAAHLQQHHKIALDLGLVFTEMRHLAEQSYENKSITYGLLIRSDGEVAKQVFPSDFFGRKRYRALSDGFRTAFEVTSSGKLLGLIDMQELGLKRRQQHFYPEWCEHIAEASTDGACGVALTRQGDLLVFDSGNLRFTYRVGRWQYWNHRHVCDLFRNRARVQHVPANVLPKVVRSIYRAALDVSFRRSGALFVLLRNRKNKLKLVIPGDAIADGNREELHSAFDKTLGDADVQRMSRVLLTELSGLDGGVVLDNKGRILAYGAVLKASGRFSPSEGSRTKAAVSASRYGIAVKVSSDGDITFYEGRKVFLEL